MYMQWVRRQPCCARDLSPCDGHVQADHAGRRGTGQKADDRTCIALCAHHHRQRADFHGIFKTWKQDDMRAWLVGKIREHLVAYDEYLARERRFASGAATDLDHLTESM
jgi:hypothetical protein